MPLQREGVDRKSVVIWVFQLSLPYLDGLFMGTETMIGKDLKGLQFGLLIVQREGEPQGKRHLPVWVCRCACGTEKAVRYDALQDGRTRSCGCATQRFKK